MNLAVLPTSCLGNLTTSAGALLADTVLRTWASIAPALVTDNLKKPAPLLPNACELIYAFFFVLIP